MHEVDFKIPCWYTCNKDSNYGPNYDCRKICPRYKIMNFLIINCGMPNADRYLKQLIPAKQDKDAFLALNDIKNNIKQLVNDGFNLFIASKKMQNGKTSWSLKILYKYFNEIWCGSDYVPRGYFLYVPDFIQKNKSFEYKNTSEFKEIDKILMNADLVIWDDITANPLLPSEQALLNNYISKRIQCGKANIFNGMERLNLKEYLGETLATRFENFEKVVLVEKPGKIKKVRKS